MCQVGKSLSYNSENRINARRKELLLNWKYSSNAINGILLNAVGPMMEFIAMKEYLYIETENFVLKSCNAMFSYECF